MSASDGDSSPPKPDRDERAHRILKQGTFAYGLVAVLPLLNALLQWRGPFGLAGGLAVAVLIPIAPFLAWRGSEPGRLIAGLVGLLTAMASFGSGCAIVDQETRLAGFVSLFAFIASCFVVRAFLMNMDTANYIRTLRPKKPSD